jgi:hypothetical protein
LIDLDRIMLQAYGLGSKREKAAVTHLLARKGLRALRPGAVVVLLLFLQATASVLGWILPPAHGSGEPCLTLGQNSERNSPAPAPRDHSEQCCVFYCSGADATALADTDWISERPREALTLRHFIAAADPAPAIHWRSSFPRAPPQQQA